jgi:transposase
MSMPAVNLPEKISEAHALISGLYDKIARLTAENTEVKAENTGVIAENQQLKWQLQSLKKQLFGPSADRALPESYSSEQVLLGLFPPPSEPPATQEVVLPEEQEPARNDPPRRRRHPEIKALQTETQRIEPADKVCERCGREKCEIGCEKCERLEYIPAKMVRRIIERPKLACPCGEGQISIAPPPSAPIDKGLPGPGLLAHVVLSKYEDHSPLYRQQQQFARLGVQIPRTTLCDWIEKGAALLQPIAHAIKEELVLGNYLQVDETPVKLMDPEVQGKCATGFLWVAGRPGGDVIFEFKTRRNKECALELLGNFSGYLQRDGYGVYGSIAQDRPDLTPVGCLAHGRRKFVEALADEPKQAEWFVAELRKLYRIESHAREQTLTPTQRHELRQKLAVPIWAEMTPRLEELHLKEAFLPKSPMGKALNYAYAEWKAWQVYLSNGLLEIDNNLTENAIRPSAVGKKNWLFIGHPEAGWRSAVIYSILVSCRRRGIDTWTYLQDVFTRLPDATNQQIADFTPARWKELRTPQASFR